MDRVLKPRKGFFSLLLVVTHRIKINVVNFLNNHGGGGRGGEDTKGVPFIGFRYKKG